MLQQLFVLKAQLSVRASPEFHSLSHSTLGANARVVSDIIQFVNLANSDRQYFQLVQFELACESNGKKADGLEGQLLLVRRAAHSVGQPLEGRAQFCYSWPKLTQSDTVDTTADVGGGANSSMSCPKLALNTYSADLEREDVASSEPLPAWARNQISSRQFPTVATSSLRRCPRDRSGRNSLLGLVESQNTKQARLSFARRPRGKRFVFESARPAC